MANQAQEIAVTCKSCGAKCRCTVPEWTDGFPCQGCGNLIQRPAPKSLPKASPVGTSSGLIAKPENVQALKRDSIPARRADDVNASATTIPRAGGALAAMPQSVAQAMAASTSLNITVERMRAENHSLKEKVKEVTIALARNEAEAEVVKQQHEKMSQQYHALQAAQSTLTRQFEALKTQNETFAVQAGTQQSRAAQDLAQLRGARDEAESSLMKLQVEHKIIKEKLDDFVREKVDLGKRIQALDEQARQMEAEKNQLKANEAAIQLEKQALQSEKAELQKEQESLQAHTVELAKQVIPQDKLDAFKKKFASEVAQNRIIKLKLEQAGEQLKQQHVAVAMKDAEMQDLRRQLAESESRGTKAAEDTASQSGMENRILRGQVDSLISELHQMEDAAKTKGDEVAALTVERQRLEALLNDARSRQTAEASDQQDKTARLESRLAGLVAEIATLKAQLADADQNAADGGDLRADNQSLRHELESMRQQMSAMAESESEVAEELGTTNASLLAEIDELRQRLATGGTTAASDASTPASPEVVAELFSLRQANAALKAEHAAELAALRARHEALAAELTASRAAAVAAASATATPAAAPAPVADTKQDDLILGLKKALAKAMAESKIMHEKMVLMTESVKSAREVAAVSEALQARVHELEAAAVVAATAAAAATPAPASSAADHEALIRSQAENKVMREQLDKVLNELDAARTAAKNAATAGSTTTGAKSATAEQVKQLENEKQTLDVRVKDLEGKLNAATATASAAVAAAAASAVAGAAPGTPAAAGAEAMQRAVIENQVLREQLDKLVGELDVARKAAASGAKTADAKSGKGPADAAKGDPKSLTDAKAIEARAKKFSDENAALVKEKAELEARVTELATNLEQAKAAPVAAVPVAAVAGAGADAAADIVVDPVVQLAEVTAANAALAAQVEALSSDLAIAKAVLNPEPEPADGKKKKAKAPGTGGASASPDKMRLFEAMQENSQLKKEVEKLRKRVKDERGSALVGLVKPDITKDVEALYLHSRELEHKLVILEQERKELLAEVSEQREAEKLKDHSVTKATLKSPVVQPDFPPAVASTVRDLLGDAPLFFAARTTHKVDTGLWVRKSACHLALSADDLAIVAPGKVDVVQKVPRERLRESFWNPVTHQLVFSPGLQTASIKALSIDPELARELLVLLQAEHLIIDDRPAEQTEVERKLRADEANSTDTPKENEPVGPAAS